MYSKQKTPWYIFQYVAKALAYILSTLTLVSCSIAPLYSNQTSSSLNLNFAEPNSRLEQIVYADLVQYFGRSKTIDAQMVTIHVSSSPITPGLGSVGLVGTINIAQAGDDDLIYSGSRTASATYLSSNQSLANQQAANEASERAAHNLAQTIRVTLLSILSLPPAP